MTQKIKVAFASGTDDLNARLIERMRGVFPELPLYVVSEFPPGETDLHWVRYRGGIVENLARCRSAFRGKSIRLAGVLLVPNVPFRRMRLLALILAPLYFLAVNENLNDFMLRPRCLPAIVRHFLWRIGNYLRWHLGKDGMPAQRGWHDVAYVAAWIAGGLRLHSRGAKPALQTEGVFCAPGAGDRAGGRLQYVLHGNAQSHYDDAKLHALGGLDTTYSSSEVQYLDLCFRAWQRGWPIIGAANLHLTRALENPSLDNLKFLARTISSPKVFRHYWRRALKNLHKSKASRKLWQAAALALTGRPPNCCTYAEESFLALTDGTSAVYPGKSATGKPRLLVASAYVPFPLSHGGAVRIHNLTERAAAEWDQILICFTDSEAPPPSELLERFVEVVLVRREGSHAIADSQRPEVVGQFDSPVFRAILRHTMRKWRPSIAQLEFTQMAQYAHDCAPASTILVEHDITFDLYGQLAQNNPDWDLHRQLKLWRSFEIAAWRDMSCVVTMSAKDQALVTGTRSVTLPNGVDLDRFRVSSQDPEPGRLLFVGSFSHLPNMMALAFFLNDAWPQLRSEAPGTRLHIIAGANHEYFLDYQNRQVQLHLDQPGIELEGFVSDVRPAYARAAVVIAPLIASAGTNLKILEAMACGRPVVSTPAGVNGLDLTPSVDFILVHTGEEMAAAIARLFASPEECRRLAGAGRRRVEESYGWDAIADRQSELYRELSGCARS